MHNIEQWVLVFLGTSLEDSKRDSLRYSEELLRSGRGGASLYVNFGGKEVQVVKHCVIWPDQSQIIQACFYAFLCGKMQESGTIEILPNMGLHYLGAHPLKST